MINNLFEIAVENDEVDKFFLGEGRYLSMNRETNEHAYYAQVKGWGEKYISENPEVNTMVFVIGFVGFLKTGGAKGNLKSVLGALLAIVSIFEKNDRLLSEFKERAEDLVCGGVRSYFSSIGANENISLYRDRIAEIGCVKVAEAMKVL